jgi:hypothetical protein
MSVWQVGAREVLWLVGRGDGEGPGGVFLEKDQREREREAAAIIFKVQELA